MTTSTHSSCRLWVLWRVLPEWDLRIDFTPFQQCTLTSITRFFPTQVALGGYARFWVLEWGFQKSQKCWRTEWHLAVGIPPELIKGKCLKATPLTSDFTTGFCVSTAQWLGCSTRQTTSPWSTTSTMPARSAMTFVLVSSRWILADEGFTILWHSRHKVGAELDSRMDHYNPHRIV